MHSLSFDRERRRRVGVCFPENRVLILSAQVVQLELEGPFAATPASDVPFGSACLAVRQSSSIFFFFFSEFLPAAAEDGPSCSPQVPVHAFSFGILFLPSTIG